MQQDQNNIILEVHFRVRWINAAFSGFSGWEIHEIWRTQKALLKQHPKSIRKTRSLQKPWGKMEKSTSTFLGGSPHLPIMNGYVFLNKPPQKKGVPFDTLNLDFNQKGFQHWATRRMGFCLFYLSFLKKLLGCAIEGVMFFKHSATWNPFLVLFQHSRLGSAPGL